MSEPGVPGRGRGRPRKLPLNGKGLRLTVSNEEADLIERARALLRCSQNEFTRAAVINFARSVLDAHGPGRQAGGAEGE